MRSSLYGKYTVSGAGQRYLAGQPSGRDGGPGDRRGVVRSMASSCASSIAAATMIVGAVAVGGTIAIGALACRRHDDVEIAIRHVAPSLLPERVTSCPFIAARTDEIVMVLSASSSRNPMPQWDSTLFSVN